MSTKDVKKIKRLSNETNEHSLKYRILLKSDFNQLSQLSFYFRTSEKCFPTIFLQQISNKWNYPYTPIILVLGRINLPKSEYSKSAIQSPDACDRSPPAFSISPGPTAKQSIEVANLYSRQLTTGGNTVNRVYR